MLFPFRIVSRCLILTACYPFNTCDPFLFENCPDVVFAGNQKTFGSKTVQGEKGGSDGDGYNYILWFLDSSEVYQGCHTNVEIKFKDKKLNIKDIIRRYFHVI